MTYRLYLYLLPFLMLLGACTEAATEQNFTDSENNYQYGDAEVLPEGLDTATFAGGCFWCTEAYFERLKGVSKVVSGYAGGNEQNPSYEAVSAGQTGHAEGVQVSFDPKQVTYQELLEVFFATHDPTTLNRQGPDVGKQYRSVVFYHNKQQEEQTRQYLQELAEAGTYKNRIVTEVQPLTAFWMAEDYHQDYYRRNSDDLYVQRVAMPKVIKFENAFRSRLKNQNQ